MSVPRRPSGVAAADDAPTASVPRGARRQALALRKERLLLRSEQLRDEVTAQSQALVPWLQLAEAPRSAWDWGRTHPLMVAVALAGLAIWRPRRVWRWGWRAWSVYRWWQSLRRPR